MDGGKKLTREEVINKIIHDIGGLIQKKEGKKYKAIIASLPDGYAGINEGYSFLLSTKSIDTGEIFKNRIFYRYVDNNGNYSPFGCPLHENVLAQFDIDWDAGTAKVKE
jgi:hypothetical protein